MSSNSSIACSILDIPDEILAKIILPFNARERVDFGNSCQRFCNLVFGDKELLRDLDFSKNGQLTAVSDIQRYFENVNMHEFILKVNIQNVKCLNSEKLLSASISKAINIVDLNIHGLKFKNIKELTCFLQPLVHLKRLSVDWPKPQKDGVAPSDEILQKSLSRLTYFSVHLYTCATVLLPTVQFCQDLEELRMVTKLPHSQRMRDIRISLEPIKLRNLKIVQFRGQLQSELIKDHLLSMVSDSHQWIDFHLVNPFREGYLEKNVELCAELWQLKVADFNSISYPYGSYNNDIDWPLVSEFLLSEVIEITHEDTPQHFCCLTVSSNVGCQQCLLNIDEAKQLLKDPRYQISYLHLLHTIDPDCDAHLVVSAFPNLSELVLGRICNWRDRMCTGGKKKRFKRRLRRRDSTTPAEVDDPKNRDSSFKMLVENSPDLRGLTIAPNQPSSWENDFRWWDMDALYLISRWKNLTAIRLRDIPIKNGKFLVDIGKECTKLEEIMLYRLGSGDICCYTSELLQMLTHCRNLNKFSICQRNLDNMSELFTLLSNNPKLRTIRLITKTEFYDSVELVSSIEELLHRCSELIKFVFLVRSRLNRVDDELKPALERIVGQLNRKDFQFHGPALTGSSTFYDDAPISFFPSPLDDQQFMYY